MRSFLQRIYQLSQRRSFELLFALLQILNVGLAISLMSKNSLLTILIIACDIGIVLWIWWFRKRNLQMLAILLHEPTAEPLIAWYRKREQLFVPHVDGLLEYVTATTYIYYGDFAQAHGAINSFDWSGKKSLVSALGLVLETLCDYLERHDYEAGYQRALQARNVAKIPRWLPVSRTTRRTYDIYVIVGELLRGNHTLEILTDAEALFPHIMPLDQLLLARALFAAYTTLKRPDDAERMHTFFTTTAPYAKGLYGNR